jgi:RimK family alpha-L-glutamate ligase
MKMAIIYGEVSTTHQLMIERAKDIFDSVLAAPVSGIKFVHGEESKVFYKGTDITDYDAVYIRTSDEDMHFSEHLSEVLRGAGVVTQAESDTYSYESNKFYSMKILAENGVSVPDSVYTLSPERAVEAAKELEYPVIMKTVKGGGGEGVMRASSEKELKPVMDTMKSFEQEICLQEYIEHGGTDTRVLKIGDFITGYSRSSVGEDWRSNISGGGERKEADMNEQMKEAARKAAAATGFDICGSDIINPENPQILEINGSFGFNEDVNKLLGEDIILLIVERMHERAMEKQREN